MYIPCEIENQAEQPTLSIRTTTSAQELPELLGRGYGAIAKYLQELGVYPSGAPFVVYFNLEMQNLDVEFGFPVPYPLPDHGEIHASRMAAGKAASTIYTGPYPQMATAYEALTRFVAEQGYQATGVSVEYYLNDPTQTQQDELQTRIVFPLT